MQNKYNKNTARIRREYQEKERRHRMLSILYATLFSPISIVLDNDTFKVFLPAMGPYGFHSGPFSLARM